MAGRGATSVRFRALQRDTRVPPPSALNEGRDRSPGDTAMRLLFIPFCKAVLNEGRGRSPGDIRGVGDPTLDFGGDPLVNC